MPAGESDRARIKQQIRAQIASGTLAPGQQLPSAAELARQHGVHQRTAANALYELRDDKVIYPRRGRGYYVAGADPEVRLEPTVNERLAALERRVSELEQRQ